MTRRIKTPPRIGEAGLSTHALRPYLRAPSPLAGLARKARRVFPLSFKRLSPRAVVDLGRFISLPPGYHPMNPSVVAHGGRFVVCVRGVNYTLRRPGSLDYVFTSGAGHDTQNRFFLMDGDLSFAGRLPGLDRAFAGVEDVKLFSARGALYGIGSRASRAFRGGGCEIVVGAVDAALGGAALRAVASPFGRRQEKNWVPLVMGDAIHFVYSISPLLLFRYCPRSGGLAPVPGPGAVGAARRDLPFLISGSSPSLPLGDGHLVIAHRRVFRVPAFRRIYLSRAYVLAPDLSAVAGGPYFSIDAPAIQFVNGIAATAESVHVSYGEEDSRAYLASFARADFIEAVRPRR